MTTQTFTPPASLPAYALSSLNALSHGGSAESLFIPGENPADYYRELDEAFATHQPATAQDSHIVHESVHARWILSRRTRAHARVEHDLHTQHPDPLQWLSSDLYKIELLDRYKTQAERAFRRSLSNLQSIRKEAFTQERWHEHLKLAIEKTEIQRRKFELAKEKYERPLREAAAEAANLEAFNSLLANSRAKIEADHAPIQSSKKFGGCVIVQHIEVSEKKGQAYIELLSPNNTKVRQIIDQRASYAQPPQKVVRMYFFNDGIPPEYEFLIDENNPRPIEEVSGTEHEMSFDQWLSLAEIEDELLAHQPELKEDPDDE